MERVTKLYLEASALRALAERMDMLPIRDQLLGLAARCEQMAKSIAENPEMLISGPDAVSTALRAISLGRTHL
jgi:hypothetical protein